MPDRLAVAAALREIGLRLRLSGGNPHRAKAYERGAQAVESFPIELQALAREGRLREIPGIGEGLARVVAEILDTGRSAVLESLRREMPDDALLRHAEARAAERPGALLHEAQRDADAVVPFLRARPHVLAVEIAGALRRRLEVVDRLDVVGAAPDPAATLATLAPPPEALAELGSEPEARRFRLASGLVLRVVLVAPDRFALAWLFATGSTDHVAALVARARDRGLHLDAAGLASGSSRLPVASEADVYERLGLPFVPPEMREGDGEIAAAIGGRLPPPLVVEADVRGAVHCHTTESDGRHSLLRMARAARAAGLEYMTVTDHSATAFYAGGLTLDRLERQWDEIERVQAEVGIRLLRGSEVDILRDGALDWPDAVLERLDVVIASVHNRYRLDERAMTDRVVRALRHPVFKIWGHALGRYVLRRPPIAVRTEEVLDAAAASRVAIEINGDPHRLDMEPRLAREARRRGLRFTLSVDAHATGELGNLRWAVAMARRAWLTRDDVLNTRDAAAFAAAVRPR